MSHAGGAAGGPVPINIAASPFTRAEMFDADVWVEDEKWYPAAHHGKLRPLLFDTANGGWVVILKVESKGTIQRHRHAAPVSVFTLDGAWGYREHDWLARAGSYVYEPAGHIHTLFVDETVGRMTAIFHTYGPVVYVDEQGNATDYDDVFTRLDRYAKHCRKAGLPDSWVQSLIR